ncbi:12777_t:CDS:1 [Racocetra persica]|uniref:12777_t:CDS:1 n=1 Tax=Racocetra persica TaxID=160502 RepID=A0ACA9S9I3_9GLOM|nr:12777_t:CDS:1 [Racocetra persica]
MPFTKEQYQEYYQKIKEERNRKRREKYLAQKVRVDESQARQKIVNPKKEVDETLLNQVDEIKVDEKLRERVDEKNVKSEVDEVAPPKNKVDENAEPLRNVEPKIVNQVELELAPNVESVNASKNKNKAEREEQFKSEVIKISRIIPDEFLVKTNAPRKMVEGKEYFCINGR